MTIRTIALRLVQASSRAVLGIAIGVGCSAPASGQDCTMEFSQPGEPLPGISSFSASATVVVTVNCAASSPACGGTFTAQSSADHGMFTLRCCSCFGLLPLRWFRSGHSSNGWVSDGGVVAWSGNFAPPSSPFTAQTSFSATIAFSHPVRVFACTCIVTGGRVLYGTRVIHAGETVTLASDGTLFNSPEGWFEYGLCLDVQPENGICDEYDDAARAFGDFNSSGSIDGADLATLLAAWGSSGGPCDINRDGVVDANDLTFLLSRWGQGA